MRYLIDIMTEPIDDLVEELIAKPEGKYDEGRYLYQVCNAGRDALLTKITGFALYHPSLESMERYKDTGGVAISTGEESVIVSNINKILENFKGNQYAGWEIKTFIVPVLYRRFINYDVYTNLIDTSFDLYPFDNKKTTDLSNVFNFNRQMITTRSRNQYHLNEMFYAYGGIRSNHVWKVGNKESEVKARLLDRIEMGRFLFNKWGFEW